MDYSSPLEALKRHWGYDTFRPLQAEIVDSALSGADTLALMPTGGGKSITFQVPALLMPGLTVVVTPLISLMKDQVDNLRARDIPAVYLHSGLTRAEARLGMQKAGLGKVKLLYLSPERLQNERFVNELKDCDVSLIVVDEAHCISQWGYDFRPSYLAIAKLRRFFPEAPVMALTASATTAVADDIRTQLEFRPGHRTFRKSFARPNISYVVRQGENKPERLLRVLRNTSGPAIVYVRSRRRTREIADALNAAGITADFYHAGLAPEDKDLRQQRWKQGAARVMVATNAFGMGIDKPDVRMVVHYDLPSSIEEYYQEAGRAGRDDKPCFAVVLASAYDKASLARRLAESFPPPEFIRDVYDRACIFIDLCLGEGFARVFDFNFALFCAREKLRPAPVRAALRILTHAGYIEFNEDTDARARVMAVAAKHELYDLQLSPLEDEVLQYLLRNCPGLFADYVNISESVIAANLDLSSDEVYRALLGLTRAKAVHYVPRRQQPYLFFPSRRILSKYIELPPTVYADRRERMAERIEAMKRLVFDPGECRANIILHYFGEDPPTPCGCCDVCRNRRRQSSPPHLPDLSRRILHVASQAEETPVEKLCDALGLPRDALIPTLRELIDEGRLILNPNQTIALCKHP